VEGKTNPASKKGMGKCVSPSQVNFFVVGESSGKGKPPCPESESDDVGGQYPPPPP